MIALLINCLFSEGPSFLFRGLKQTKACTAFRALGQLHLSRQQDRELGTAIFAFRRACDGDYAAMLLHDALRHPKPEARSIHSLGRKEGLENSLLNGDWYAWS